jgi:hypothetical protein
VGWVSPSCQLMAGRNRARSQRYCFRMWGVRPSQLLGEPSRPGMSVSRLRRPGPADMLDIWPANRSGWGSVSRRSHSRPRRPECGVSGGHFQASLQCALVGSISARLPEWTAGRCPSHVTDIVRRDISASPAVKHRPFGVQIGPAQGTVSALAPRRMWCVAGRPVAGRRPPLVRSTGL